MCSNRILPAPPPGASAATALRDCTAPHRTAPHPAARTACPAQRCAVLEQGRRPPGPIPARRTRLRLGWRVTLRSSRSLRRGMTRGYWRPLSPTSSKEEPGCCAGPGPRRFGRLTRRTRRRRRPPAAAAAAAARQRWASLASTAASTSSCGPWCTARFTTRPTARSSRSWPSCSPGTGCRSRSPRAAAQRRRARRRWARRRRARRRTPEMRRARAKRRRTKAGRRAVPAPQAGRRVARRRPPAARRLRRSRRSARSCVRPSRWRRSALRRSPRWRACAALSSTRLPRWSPPREAARSRLRCCTWAAPSTARATSRASSRCSRRRRRERR